MSIFVVGGATVDPVDQDFSRQISALDSAMKAVGRGIIERGHNLLVCSPFPGSADLPALLSAAELKVRPSGPRYEECSLVSRTMEFFT